jgi:hypothetical protein
MHWYIISVSQCPSYPLTLLARGYFTGAICTSVSINALYHLCQLPYLHLELYVACATLYFCFYMYDTVSKASIYGSAAKALYI